MASWDRFRDNVINTELETRENDSVLCNKALSGWQERIKTFLEWTKEIRESSDLVFLSG